MDIAVIKTFLELAATGNFSRVADRLHITQSTVSARIKVLEEYLNCPLFDRTHTRANLTPAGHRFHHYALSMQQLWQQGRQEVALPKGFEGVVGLGIHMALWRRFLPDWISWMRECYPMLGLHVETDYSERLTEQVSQGLLDIAITHMPRALPGLHVEVFLEESLVMVSRDALTLPECNNKDYIYIDWSYGYREEHFEKLPNLHSAPINIGLGEVALCYLLDNPGFAYLPLAEVQRYIDNGRLFVVKDSPKLNRPAYLVYPEKPIDPDRVAVAIDGLKNVASASN